MKNPLTILFGGKAVEAHLIDNTTIKAFVRILPQRQLGRVLVACEDQAALIELCCYTKLPEGAQSIEGMPVGYDRVPDGWSDNLTDDSFDFLHKVASDLNFQRAAKWGQAQIAAKKLIAPLHLAAMEQLNPLVESLVEKMVKRIESSSALMRNAPPSPATPASNS